MTYCAERPGKKPSAPSDESVVCAAQRIYGSEGDVEIDDGATVSRADGNPDRGAYVQAWVWVADDRALEE